MELDTPLSEATARRHRAPHHWEDLYQDQRDEGSCSPTGSNTPCDKISRRLFRLPLARSVSIAVADSPIHLREVTRSQNSAVYCRLWPLCGIMAPIMSRSRLLETLPAPVTAELRQLGIALRRTRVARNESQRALAARLEIAERTLRNAEKGDPTVSSGALITLLWAVGLGPLSHSLSEQAARAAASGANTRARRKAQDDF
jgi:DNA-binding XRE family transcriptional regulator